MRHQPVQESQAVRFFRGDIPAREDEVDGPAVSQDPGQEPAHARVGRQVPFKEDAAEARILGTDAQVARERQAHAGAGTDAVHRGDSGFVQVVYGQRLVADPVKLVKELILGWGRLRAFRPGPTDVGTGAKSAACASQNDCPDVVVSADFLRRFEDFELESPAQGI